MANSEVDCCTFQVSKGSIFWSLTQLKVNVYSGYIVQCFNDEPNLHFLMIFYSDLIDQVPVYIT